MVGNCNLILLVPTGDDPMYTSDSVILWDDKRLKSSGTIKFTNSVEKISFTRDMYVVAQPEFITCISLKNIVVSKIETGHNPKGVHAVSYENRFCIAAPHIDKGKVLLTWFDSPDGSENSNSNASNEIKSSNEGHSYRKLNTTVITANDSGIACLALNSTGTILAVASEKVRVLFLTSLGHNNKTF